MKDKVFTYWEGTPYPFTAVCIDSVRNIFGEQHIHLTDKNISDWIDVPTNVLNSKHILFRADYIRTMLLQKYGGWWFDSDVLLIKNPSNLVIDNKPQIWNLIYRVDDEWLPLVNCGILYSPKNSTWINNIMEDFNKINPENMIMTIENEDIGQDIYEKWSINTNLCNIGNEHCFNSTINVDADYRPFWDGTITLDTVSYGLHIGASLSRWAIKNGDYEAYKTIMNRPLNQLIDDFPNSFLAEYITMVNLKKHNNY
jgi:hypothetical protein